MTFGPLWRTRLFAFVGVVIGIVLGVLIANESWFWPTVCVGALAAVVTAYVQPWPLTTLLLGGASFGYIVGNRGFAQLSLAGNFPLLPAEFVLLVGLTLLAVQSAWRHELPLRRDVLNVALLLWIVFGTIRLLYGIRVHGFSAVRDFALVYYALFFFLAQHAGRDGASARLLGGCVLSACGALLVVHPLFSNFPHFFAHTLTFRGVPLIFVKGDLAGNFMALGSVLFYARFEQSRNVAWLLVSGALAALMLTTESRSSIVGLAVGAGWLALAGRWRFASTIATAAILAAIALLIVAEIQNLSWRQTPLHRIYERVVSITDPLGQRSYRTEDAFKGDNNIFRMVWWRASVTEVIETNPWFGVGFGHDLAMRFVREYYPEGSEEFTARSPHNVLITIFARMGIVGSAAFMIVIASMAARTWRALRDPRLVFTSGAYWCGAWVLLVCACFGVMLEGPMGAVVFWTVLGIANATSVAANEVSTVELTDTPEAADPRLRDRAPADEVAATT